MRANSRIAAASAAVASRSNAIEQLQQFGVCELPGRTARHAYTRLLTPQLDAAVVEGVDRNVNFQQRVALIDHHR